MDDRNEILRDLMNSIVPLQGRVAKAVENLSFGSKKEKSSFLQTKEDQLDTVNEIGAQCEAVKEILQNKEIALENLDFIDSELESIRNYLDSLDTEYYLDSEVDLGDAIIYFTTGTGGDDSSNWTLMLKDMYEKWGDNNNYQVNEIDVAEAPHGIRSASIQICGEYVFGLLKRETGVHRLVRISPFNAQGKRQTSFASITVVPSINDDIQVQIRNSDIKIDTMKASGPGGQHVNTTDSAVRITHIPTGITATSSMKSQAQNKKLAMAVLKSRIYERERAMRDRSSEQLKSSVDQNSWGTQIRNYVLHPYQQVLDTRTRVTSTNPEKILDGSNLNIFLEANLRAGFDVTPNPNLT